MKTVLIPTDFTDVARHATDYAIRLFGGEKMRIILLNAFEQPRMGRSMHVSLIDILRKNSERGLQEDKLRIEENFPNLYNEIILHATQGELSDSIRTLIDKEKIDIVVMGSEGNREVVDLFIESRTARVIKNVDHPMLVVPPNAEIKTPESIILTTDCKPVSSPSIIDELRDLCRRFSCKVRVFHLNREENFVSPSMEKQFNELLRGIPHDINYRKNGDIPTGIYKFIQESKSEIVCLIKRKGAGSLVDRLFHVSVSRRIVKHVKQTLLLFTDQNYPSPL